MRLQNEQQSGRNLYIFNVDLMIESENNALALEQLVTALNRSGFIDFRIISGIETGRLIQQVTQGPYQLNPVSVPAELKQGRAPAATSGGVRVLASAKTSAAASGKTPGTNGSGTSGNAQGVAVDGDSPACIDAAMERIRVYIAGNRLVRLTVNRGRGVKLSVPCRIINLDESSCTVTVYHVDEKKVYTFGLFEIDDFLDT